MGRQNMKTTSLFKSKPLQAAMLAAGLGVTSLGLSAKSLGPQLSEMLPTASEAEVFEVIVTFEGEGPATPLQLNALEQLGVTSGVSLQNVPIVGLLATK